MNEQEAVLDIEQLGLITVSQPQFYYQYAVKFVCGKSSGHVVARGKYFTAINIHNPTSNEIQYRKKIAIALPGEKTGPLSEYSIAVIGPDEALEIDCPDIYKHSRTTPCCFLKGFVIIESLVELDIVAVYTAAQKKNRVETLHMERVRPLIKRIGQPDLVPEAPFPPLEPNNPPYPSGFCKSRREVVVRVKNQGTAKAGPSVTAVHFFETGTPPQLQPTSELDPGDYEDLTYLIPQGCFEGEQSCKFRITVDVNNEVAESNETNNSVEASCPGTIT